MTGFTEAGLSALEKAIAEGVLKVKYQDKEVTYRSLDEMLTLRGVMRAELGIGCRSNRRVGVYGSGL